MDGVRSPGRSRRFWRRRRHPARGVWGHAPPENYEKLKYSVVKTYFPSFLAEMWCIKSEYKADKIVYYEGTSLKQQGILNAWEIIVSAWERKIEFVCVRLTLNAWDLRALHCISRPLIFGHTVHVWNYIWYLLNMDYKSKSHLDFPFGMLQVKFDFRLNFTFLCSRLITIFPKQRKIQINLGEMKFNLKSNLTCNRYTWPMNSILLPIKHFK